MTGKEHQDWLNALWDETVRTDSEEDLYFGRTLKMLCLIAMSGNWWSPHPPLAIGPSSPP